MLPLFALAVLLAPVPADSPAGAAPPLSPVPKDRRFGALVLRAEGPALAELGPALTLRLPDLPVVRESPTDGAPFVFVAVRTDPAVPVRHQIGVITSDGAAYFREVDTGADPPARLLASVLANLLVAIAEGTVAPDRTDVAIPPPDAALPGPAPAPQVAPEPTPPVVPPPQPVPRASTPAAPRPTWEYGPVARGGLGLTRQRDGSMLYVDPGKRFTAAVNPDGSVRFGNRWGRDQHGERMRGSGAALRSFGPTGIGAGGMAMTGPTEWLLFLSGQEFDAAAKTKFLNQTRDLRIQLAVAFTLRLLQTRLDELNHELLGLWSDASRPIAERRALVFQRWDECDERLSSGLPTAGELPAEAASTIDQARLDAADRARRTIEGFIRRQMPRGTPRAYTASELAELNRRRVSVETFAPYETRQIRPTSRPVPTDMSPGAAQP